MAAARAVTSGKAAGRAMADGEGYGRRSVSARATALGTAAKGGGIGLSGDIIWLAPARASAALGRQRQRQRKMVSSGKGGGVRVCGGEGDGGWRKQGQSAAARVVV